MAFTSVFLVSQKGVFGLHFLSVYLFKMKYHQKQFAHQNPTWSTTNEN